MRLDGDLVGTADVTEPEGGHDRHHRRARRLVTADLDVAVAPSVGGVDDPRRQPEHPPLDLSHRLDLVHLALLGAGSSGRLMSDWNRPPAFWSYPARPVGCGLTRILQWWFDVV
ncbi:MAG: hypothetical protein R2697_20485 [Ilumatobacteraceae bacterium]